MNITNKQEQMWESLKDPDYRKQLIDEHINVGIAFQIHGLRQRQELTQKKLAERLGDKKKQPLISAWEDPNYGKYTLATLKDLAKAFDVGLLVRFVPFSSLGDWTVNVASDVIAPPGFNEEQPLVVAPVSEGLDFSTGITFNLMTAAVDNLCMTCVDKPNVMVGAATTRIVPTTEKEKAYAFA